MVTTFREICVLATHGIFAEKIDEAPEQIDIRTSLEVHFPGLVVFFATTGCFAGCISSPSGTITIKKKQKATY